MNRCHWANPRNPLYIEYHDMEWGIPVHDDRVLYEMLVLESFQAGLSWECVLNKREAMRCAFDHFDVKRVAEYGDERVYDLALDPGIIRNKLKIRAAINNARCFIAIQREFGSFDRYIWDLARRQLNLPADAPEPLIEENSCTTSPLSDAISLDLQRRGMKFVGSTIVYSFIQAVGIIDSHEDCCDLHCRGARQLPSFLNN